MAPNTQRSRSWATTASPGVITYDYDQRLNLHSWLRPLLLSALTAAENQPLQLFKELQRRNVFRVTIGYIVSSWLLIQVADIFTENIGSPDWIMQTIMLVLALGFPIVLFFSWAYEVTPEGIKRESEVDRSESITHVTALKLDRAIVFTLVIALAYVAYDKFIITETGIQPNAEQAAVEPSAAETNPSIAVLPFVNMSDDAGNEYFSDGLSEEILNLLAKIRDLKVIARTSSFAFKGKNQDIRLVGEALGAKTVLEGSVRKSGDRVRITAQLIDVSDGSHLWSDTYDRTITDIFAVQDDVAAAIIDALQIHVGANPDRGRPTESSEAYALFLKARASLNARDTHDAMEFLLSAIELDPKFAEAHELLAYCYWNLGGGLNLNGAEAQKLMGEAAARALALDPDLVVAQVFYQAGDIESYSYLGEIESLERGLRQQPGNPVLLEALSWDLLEAGYLQEALGIAERYVQIDPLSPDANIRWGEALYVVGRTEEALAALDLAQQLGNDFAQWNMGELNLMEKQDDIAIAHFEAFLEQAGLRGNWVRELVTGARDSATGQAHLDRQIPQIVASALEEDALGIEYTLLGWHLLFGYLDRYLDPILDLELSNSIWTDADVPMFFGTVFRQSGFTAHPKYLEIAELIGITDVWEQRGSPDFCEKVAGKWVCE